MTAGCFGNEEIIKAIDQIQFIIARDGNAQIFGDELQKLNLREVGVKNKSCFNIVTDMIQQGAAKGGFSCAHFAGHANNAFTVANTV